MKHILNLPDGKPLEITTPLVRGDKPIKELPTVFHVPFAGSSVKMVRTKSAPPAHVYDPADEKEQPAHLRKKP